MKVSSKSPSEAKSKIDKETEENHNKYRSLYENLPLIHISTNFDGLIKSINKNGAEELGYAVSELLGFHISKIFIPKEAQRIEKQIQQVLLNSEKQSSHEMKMVPKNKQEFWARETIYTVDDDHSAKEIFFVFDNITYQKNAEANAKGLAQSLQNMLDASPLGVLVYMLDEHNELILISTNESAVSILQIDVYALISKRIQEIFPSVLKDNLVEKFKEVLKTGVPFLNQHIIYEDIHLRGIYEFSAMKLSDKTIAVFFTDVTEKEKALDNLKQSELKYKTLFESANDAIFLIKDEVFIDCNEKSTQIFGAKKSEIIGQYLCIFCPLIQPDGRTSKLELQEKISFALNGDPQFFEWRYKKLDGYEFDAEISLNRIEFQNGIYLQAIVRDITERKISESIISEQKRELDTLMSNLPGMAYRCANNIQWTMQFVNEGCYELTGFTKDELLNDKVTSYSNLINKEDKLLVFETVQNAVNNKEPFMLVYRITNRQGIEKWVWEKGRAIYNDKGDLICLEGFITDITERKLAEEKAAILSNALMSVSECVVITNLHDKIMFINKSFSRVYGYSQNEVIDKPISYIRSSKNDPAIVKKILPETLAGGWHGELINVRKNGEEFLIKLSTSLITNEAGKPIALAGVSTEISNSKK